MQHQDRFELKHDSAELMHVAGPLVPATWSVPEALEAVLSRQGKPVPDRVHGYMLLDTGARNTCMAQDVADELSLAPVGTTQTYGAGGLSTNPVYEALLILTMGEGKNATKLRRPSHVLAVPRMREVFDSRPIKHGENHVRLVGLLGRDFLRHGRLIYDGAQGRFEVRMNLFTLGNS